MRPAEVADKSRRDRPLPSVRRSNRAMPVRSRRVERNDRSRISLRSALVGTGGIACFLACSRLLIEIGIDAVLVMVVMAPGAIGAFYGLAATRLGQRNPLLGSLTGCVVGLLPAATFLLLWTVAGIAQDDDVLKTRASLGGFALLICLVVGGVVGLAFSVSRGRRLY